MFYFNPAGLNCRNRVIEWVCTAILLGYALNTLIWPETIAHGNFRYLIAIGVTPVLFFWSCLFIGTIRAVALVFNGRGLPWSARLRAVGAIFGSVVFAHLALMLAFIVKDGNPLPLGFWTHAILAAGEMYSCLRAGADVNENNLRAVVRVSTRIVSSDGYKHPNDTNVVDALTRPPNAA
jgi:hypothetical protein